MSNGKLEDLYEKALLAVKSAESGRVDLLKMEPTTIAFEDFSVAELDVPAALPKRQTYLTQQAMKAMSQRARMLARQLWRVSVLVNARAVERHGAKRWSEEVAQEQQENLIDYIQRLVTYVTGGESIASAMNTTRVPVLSPHVRRPRAEEIAFAVGILEPR